MKFFSLRNRLMAGVMVSLLLGWLFAGFIFLLDVIDDTEDYIREDVSLHASNIADSLSLNDLAPNKYTLEQWKLRVEKDGPDIIPSRLQNQEHFSVQIWYEGLLLARTETGPVMAAPTTEAHLTAPFSPNYFQHSKLTTSDFEQDIDPDHLPEWWVYSARVGQHDLWVYTAQLNNIASNFWIEMAGSVIIVGLITIPFLSALAYFLIGFLLRPLERITTKVNAWRSQQYAPIDTQNLPSELALLVEYLNGLLVRLQSGMQQLDHALESEKRFTANAAHELLTPLAAIRSEAQLLQRQNKDDAFQSSLNDIIIRVDRATHTVEQLVTLARLDPDGLQAESKRINLSERLLDNLASLGDKIERKMHDLDVNIPAEPIITLGNGSGIDVMLRNILDNAIRYTEEKGSIEVNLRQHGGHIHLSVINSGRNLPDYLKAQIFERFVRGAGQSESGSGLGLSIVKRIVELHDGKVTIKDPDGVSGFEIIITLPVKIL